MYLITPSLLNSFEYYRSYEGEAEESVRADFIRTLTRERSQPTEAMQAGIDFEDRVFAYTKENEEIEEDKREQNINVREIGDICKGGMWQQTCKREFGDYLLYARADVIKMNTIIDIKRTGTYEVGKYQKSAQHRIELYCTDMPKFSYLISDERSWWREDYYHHSQLENELNSMIREFIGYLENDSEAKTLFYGKWASL